MTFFWERWVMQWRRRRELDGWAKHFGYDTESIAAACAIARRCAGAEAALKRLADAAEREAAEAGAPGLTRAEIERLAMLAEECGELAQVVGKVLRHGWQSVSPHGGKSNASALEREIGDVRAVVGLMIGHGDVRLGDIQHWQRCKREVMGRWTHHQSGSGRRAAVPGEEGRGNGESN